MSVTSRLYKIIERGKEGSNKGLSTGLPKLDKIIYGVQRRCFTTIGGDTGLTIFNNTIIGDIQHNCYICKKLQINDYDRYL